MADHDRLREQADELALRYVDRGSAGPGLYRQLRAALGDPPRREGGDAGHRQPGSRPPGWRADVSELLSDIRRGVADHLLSIGRPPTRNAVALAHRPPLSPVAYDLLLLPDLAVDWDVLGDDMGRWISRARISLGYSLPAKGLPQVVCRKRVLTRSGWREIGCGEASLRVLSDASSAVWCAEPGCHDDLTYPDCTQGEDGLWSCRRTVRDTRHAIRWSPSEWLQLYADQQRKEQEAG